jgi:putative ABC transport system substrate-binding protein
MAIHIRRREFVFTLGGAAAAWPLAARAQQPAMPVIGFLNSASAEPSAHLMTAFRQGLSEIGYVEGRNVAIEFRWADGRYDRLPALAAELIARGVSVLTATGGDTAARAAKAATATIPIVFSAGGDPIEQGFVVSFNRPGGNATGVSLITSELAPKRLETLREVVPNASVIGILLNPNSATGKLQERDAAAAARTLGQRLLILNAGDERELDAAFTAIVAKGIGAVIVGADPFFTSRRHQLVELASRHGVPAIYEWPEFVKAGGLMSYGTKLTDGYRQVGIYTGRILNGERPADLPVVRSTLVEFVVNLKTARALGVTIPIALLARADEVIE